MNESWIVHYYVDLFYSFGTIWRCLHGCVGQQEARGVLFRESPGWVLCLAFIQAISRPAVVLLLQVVCLEFALCLSGHSWK